MDNQAMRKDEQVLLVILVGSANSITLKCTREYAQATIGSWYIGEFSGITTFGTKDEHHAALRMEAVIGMYITEIPTKQSDDPKLRLLRVQEKIADIMEEELKNKQEGDEWKHDQEFGD